MSLDVLAAAVLLVDEDCFLKYEANLIAIVVVCLCKYKILVCKFVVVVVEVLTIFKSVTLVVVVVVVVVSGSFTKRRRYKLIFFSFLDYCRVVDVYMFEFTMFMFL